MQQARQAFDRRFLVPQAAGQLRLVTALFLNDRVHTGRNPFELLPMCPGEHCRAILLEASSPRVLGCHNPRLSRVCTRGYSPPNECVLTSGTQAKISIALRKRISAGAGLGGGSSDAAAVLKGLNVLLSLRLSEEQLCSLGAHLGADVPFFISCCPAK